MSARAVYVVSLWVESDRIAQFEAFEARAAALMQRHDGTIERVIRQADASSHSTPFEIHLVSFPDAVAFERYLADPDVLALASTRDQVITRTELFRGHDLAPYSSNRAPGQHRVQGRGECQKEGGRTFSE